MITVNTSHVFPRFRVLLNNYIYGGTAIGKIFVPIDLKFKKQHSNICK